MLMEQWETFLQEQEKILGKEIVAKWLRSLKVVHFDACNLYLQAEDQFQIAWFDEHLRSLVQARLFNNNHHPIKVHLSLAAAKKQGKAKRPLREESYPPFKIDADPLLEGAKFETFTAGDKNKTLYQFLLDLELASFNPIFIYGDKGAGKTHLLMACAKALISKGILAFYVHADTFTEHVVKAIRNFQMQEFRKIYRHQQVLIIDDVHLLARKAATQEELFHTFNTFHTQSRQIILSSEVPPSRLTEIEPRLVSRFEWGILFHLENVMQKQLIAVLTPEIIVQRVADYFGIRPADILGKSQTRECVFPRQIAMELCHTKLNMAYLKIGHFFARDHSTVMSGIKQIKKKKNDPDSSAAFAFQEIERLFKF